MDADFFSLSVLAQKQGISVHSVDKIATSGMEIVSHQTFVMKRPPQHVPTGTGVDGPILGKWGPRRRNRRAPEEQRFYFGKNDFWNRQASPMSVGGLILNIPTVAGASYRQDQDLAKSEVRGTFTIHGVTLKARSWAQASENLAVTELSVEGRTGSADGTSTD